MNIDWYNFTPWSALGGGALIGLAAALMFLLLGRIAGISGILGGLLLRGEPDDRVWRLGFLGGLLLSPLFWLLIEPEGVPYPGQPMAAPGDWALFALAGLLVGFGTQLANGCTSGHGVCGLARLSRRSLVAVLCFMGSGVATVFVTRHLIGG